MIGSGTMLFPYFKKWANHGLFCLFSSLPHDTNQYKLIKVSMVCFGLKPGAAGWKAKTNRLSYGSTPIRNDVSVYHFVPFLETMYLSIVQILN